MGRNPKEGPSRFHFDPKLQEFEQQPGEPDRAFEAFVVYRDLGPERTAEKASERLHEICKARGAEGMNTANVYRAASNYQWRRRLSAWNNERDRIRREVELQEIQDMNKRHAKLALQLQEIAGIEVAKLHRVAKTTAKSDDAILAFENVLKTIDQSVKLERTSRGQPEAIVEERRKGPDKDEEREDLRAVLADPESLETLEKITDRVNANPRGPRSK